ncbi:Vacuolar sorting-associated protein 13, N-terminal [Popillia japonica]|uniref:Vacuolar sorting-associated protein 13, N-terminal n=1 Tax=Popillia japonica TaxID=7064 RepID=A0AAW1MHV8_POPJA
MLAGLVAWVLNNYLGKYVENLNTDQLSIALLSGEVELENLPLKKDAFRHLGLPLEVKAGFIGKVKLQIPVRQIRSAPWVIVIEQLYVVASPLPVLEWDAVAEEISAQETKLSQLDNLEVRWRLENSNKENNATYYASTYSSWLSYGTGLITNIIENLQLKIRDVHFRYEDNVSIPNKAVAIGVTVEALSAQSCNENWVPGFSHWDSSASSFKLLEMQKLAVYCVDLEYDKLFMKLGLGEIAVAMSPGQSSRHNQYYILAPVSAQAKIKRNRSERPLRSNDTPRIVCDLQLDEVPMTLDNCQHDRMVKCIKGLDDVARFRSYRYYRPACTVKEDPRAWWLYAISCLYPGKQPAICRPRPTWESCLQHAEENVQYVRIYTKLLTSPNIALVPEDKKLKEQIEWNRSFDELKILRELSMRSVPLQNQPAASNGSAGRGVLVRWFPQWIGWYSSSTVPETTTETTQLEGEILQALSDTFEDNTLLRRDVVFGQFSFTIKSGLLNLSTIEENGKDRIPMMEFEFKNLCLNVTSRPRSSSHTIELSLGAIYLKDKITPNTIFPVLVGPPGHDRTSIIRSRGPSPRVSVASKPEDLFSLVYEKCTANSGCDYRLTVRSKCLDVVYQPAAIKWLIEFVLLPYQRVITHSSIEAMKTRTKKGLIKNWEQMLDGRVTARKIWEIDLDISAPQIFFVEKFQDQNSCMAVLDFGRFQISNSSSERIETISAPEDITNKTVDDDELFVTPCSTPPVSEESNSDSSITAMNIGQQLNESLTEGNLHDKLYDRYNVELTDMQVLVGKVKDNWRYAHNKGTSTMHVLDRFNISLKIERRIVHTTDPLYPSLTVNANLPKLVAHFNESKISSARTLMQIISSTAVPSPFNACESLPENLIVESLDEDDSTSVDTSIEMSRLMMLQFTVDHLAMEVQSRGRSVAELQVSGVKIAFTKRPIDTSITLTVHSLLLVDALQTFGPDFELLVASHKHVGMDSMSGSLRDSEPTSPTSPGSPDPTIPRPQATSPVALKQALTSLAASPPLHQYYRGVYNREPSILDAEALISIEVILVAGPEPMQLANIQFNNLDIIGKLLFV